MWVFGYGSLMWDNWQNDFECERREKATLPGYRRDFNKSSVVNWGTGQSPCPTLGLAEDEAGECVGLAFQLPAKQADALQDYLSRREGASFTIEERDIRLDSGPVVTAVVPINDTTTHTYIGDRSIADRATLVNAARGTSGACIDYVEQIHAHLSHLGVEDPAVEMFWRAVVGAD